MAKKRKNPFYVLLLVVGVAFTITAFSYGVMLVRQSSSQRLEEPELLEPAPGSLMDVMDKHGFTILMIELGMLALLTCAAILTDDYWEQQDVAEIAPVNVAQDEQSATDNHSEEK